MKLNVVRNKQDGARGKLKKIECGCGPLPGVTSDVFLLESMDDRMVVLKCVYCGEELKFLANHVILEPSPTHDKAYHVFRSSDGLKINGEKSKLEGIELRKETSSASRSGPKENPLVADALRRVEKNSSGSS